MGASVISGDPQPYLDAIDYVIDAQPSTASFISQINAIVDDAENELTGDDLNLVYATASVTVDSHDYWITQDGLSATADSLENEYGSCLTLEDDPPTCFYDASTSRDIGGMSRTLVRQVSLSASLRMGCYSTHMSPWKVLRYDAGGAIGGFLTTLNPGGAAAGALAASVAEATMQGIDYLVCKYQE